MKRDNFFYKTCCEIIILSDNTGPGSITKELGISPSRSFTKGERTLSKNSGSLIVKPYNLWALKSEFTELEDESISRHIEYFKSVFVSKTDILAKYKKKDYFEISFWIWIETDNAGIGLDLREEELSFINSISNSIHFSLICNNEAGC